MDLEEMTEGLTHLENAIEFLRNAGEDGLAEKVISAMAACLDRYEDMGGDRTMFDAAII